MELLEKWNWRYATKKFDATKKVSDSDIKKIKEVVNLSPSSYGLQPYKVIQVESKEIREKLKAAAWGQGQVTDASHLFVFCSYKDLRPEHVEEYFELKAKVFDKPKSDFEGYISFINGKVAEKSVEERSVWNSRQAYIALGSMLSACAELKIDVCPMEGFEPEAFAEILDLDSKGLDAVVAATVGYRSEEDQTQHLPKVRKSIDNLFETI